MKILMDKQDLEKVINSYEEENDGYSENDSDDNGEILKYDKWIKYPNGEIYPSQNVEVKSKVDAGVYSLRYNREKQMFYLIENRINIDNLIETSSKESNIIKNEVKEFWENKEAYDNKGKLKLKIKYENINGQAGS